MTTTYPLSIEEFRNWLESKQPQEIVGMIKNGGYCPIAEALKLRNRHVYVDDIYTEINFKRINNPLWVQTFTRRLDSDWLVTNKATAKEAIEVLSEIENALFN